MMDASALLAMYEKGAIIANELIVRCLLLVDPDNPSLVLDALPREILERMLEFVGKYQPDRLVSNHDGPLPTLDQFEASRRWIEAALRKASAAPSRA